MDSCRADIIILFCFVPSILCILFENAKKYLSCFCLDRMLFGIFNETERNSISAYINHRFLNEE